MTLEECLTEYKSLTIIAIESIKEEKVDELCDLIARREILINQIKKLDVSNIAEIGRSLNLMQFERELAKLFIQKKRDFKLRLDDAKKSKTANKTYNNNRNNINGFLNLKI